jgi:hypothetical protein
VWSARAEFSILGEPVFVPRPGLNREEDDGWVITQLYDCKRHETQFVVLDARNLGHGPVARAKLAHHTPYGFHGTFTPEVRFQARHTVSPPDLTPPTLLHGGYVICAGLLLITAGRGITWGALKPNQKSYIACLNPQCRPRRCVGGHSTILVVVQALPKWGRGVAAMSIEETNNAYVEGGKKMADDVVVVGVIAQWRLTWADVSSPSLYNI